MVLHPLNEPATRVLHDRVVSKHVRPRLMLPTCSPTDDVWFIRVDDYTEEYFTFDFRQAVRAFPKNEFLTDPERENDLITIKVTLLVAMKGKPFGWIENGSSAYGIFKRMLQFIRWRLHNNIESNQELNSAWFDLYVAKLKEGGTVNLLGINERVEEYIQALKRRELDLQYTERMHVDKKYMTAFMGLSHFKQIQGAARKVLISHFNSRKIKYSRQEGRNDNVAHAILSQGAIYSILSPWYFLHEIRSELQHDPIGYQAFTNKRELQAACKWGLPTVRTDDCPELQTAALMNSSLKLTLRKDLVLNIIELVRNGLVGNNVNDVERYQEINAELNSP